MPIEVKAVYENGVLRPLEPLDLPESQEVMVTVSTVSETEEFPALYDVAFIRRLREELKGVPPPSNWEEVRERLAQIPGNWSDDIIAARGER